MLYNLLIKNYKELNHFEEKWFKYLFNCFIKDRFF